MRIEADILLADDEKGILDLMEEVLLKGGFHHIRKACNGADALRIYRELYPYVIILDIMLPDVDGLEVCKKIREFFCYSILFLSSRSNDIDKILGFSRGGDDYIIKPFSPKEVVFCVRAQLRHQQYRTLSPSGHNTRLTIGPLIIDKESCRVWGDGREVKLTSWEFLLSAHLIGHGDHIISERRLYEQVWGEYSSICDNTIMMHVRHLRERIEDSPFHPQQLITVGGLGYKLKRRVN